MTTVILSPHLDDAIFSCGGLISQWRKRDEEILILTIFAASPPPGKLFPFARLLHFRWKLGRDPVAGRRLEDRQACESLGCKLRHLDFADCIYRANPLTGLPIVRDTADLFVEIQEGEKSLVIQLAALLRQLLPGNARILTPLGVGGHVDHRITRSAAELLDRSLSYYADFPYASVHPEEILPLVPSQAVEVLNPLEEDELQAWKSAIREYRSQISSFWESRSAMEEVVSEYAQIGGIRLWNTEL